MNINIVGQKFIGSDEELVNYINNDLASYIGKIQAEYFKSKENAIKIGEMINIHLDREASDLKTLIQIRDSKDLTRLEQQELIEKNDSIGKIESRIEILKSTKECSGYKELLGLLIEYYKSKDYSTVLDVKFLSMETQLIIFYLDGYYYTSLICDDDKSVVGYILKNENFKEYSFSADADLSSLSDSDFEEYKTREAIWKSIYGNMLAEKSNTQIAATYHFRALASIDEVIDTERQKELLELTKSNIK